MSADLYDTHKMTEKMKALCGKEREALFMSKDWKAVDCKACLEKKGTS